jgi:hypothetical protein
LANQQFAGSMEHQRSLLLGTLDRHVWTTPAVQGECDVGATGLGQSCVRPVYAVHLTAGHDVIRESLPNHPDGLDRP